jgi:hypothetical protein
MTSEIGMKSPVQSSERDSWLRIEDLPSAAQSGN